MDTVERHLATRLPHELDREEGTKAFNDCQDPKVEAEYVLRVSPLSSLTQVLVSRIPADAAKCPSLRPGSRENISVFD